MSTTAPERAFRTLRYRDFRLLWIAEVVSITGSYAQRAAMGWQIYELTGSELDLLKRRRAIPVKRAGDIAAASDLGDNRALARARRDQPESRRDRRLADAALAGDDEQPPVQQHPYGSPSQ